MKIKSNRGFSLVEVVVAIAVLGLLVSGVVCLFGSIVTARSNQYTDREVYAFAQDFVENAGSGSSATVAGVKLSISTSTGAINSNLNRTKWSFAWNDYDSFGNPVARKINLFRLSYVSD